MDAALFAIPALVSAFALSIATIAAINRTLKLPVTPFNPNSPISARSSSPDSRSAFCNFSICALESLLAAPQACLAVAQFWAKALLAGDLAVAELVSDEPALP